MMNGMNGPIGMYYLDGIINKTHQSIKWTMRQWTPKLLDCETHMGNINIGKPIHQEAWAKSVKIMLLDSS